MNTYQRIRCTLWFILLHAYAFAYLRYQPISFELSTDKDSYYEGDKITFTITITNNDAERTLPVLVPHTQNTGQKLFYLSAYDKAHNSLLLRYSENKMLNMLVHDSGTVQITYLKPHEQITVPIYLNDFENYYNYHTQNASHHSFGVPLFAGIYQVNATYNPKGIALGDSIYSYYNDFDRDIPANGKQAIPENGLITQMIDLKIKRSADTLVSIERKNYYIKTNGYNYFYFTKHVNEINTSNDCVHITTLLPDSCSMKNEYFYNQFNDLYNEYINRFEDGDVKEYRRFTNGCPDYLYTERYNDFKQKSHFEIKLPDKRFYSVSYHQPGGRIHQETYCSEDGTLCQVTTYLYNKKGDLVDKRVELTEPCMEILLNGKKYSTKKGIVLEGN